MSAKKISAILIIVLAVIAAVVATGLIAGYAMWPWIIAYWIVLTMKNVVDYVGTKDGRFEQIISDEIHGMAKQFRRTKGESEW